MSDSISYQPIGIFTSACKHKWALPNQPQAHLGLRGEIDLYKHIQTDALSDLSGFSHIWILFHFDQAKGWRPKVRPPRGQNKRGLFATRSPHRPNPIGLSCVRLCGIDGRRLLIEDHDLIDQTPILDIKPYLAYADVKTETKQGWLEDLPESQKPRAYSVRYNAKASEQLSWLASKGTELSNEVHVLLQRPYPYPCHRVCEIKEGEYELSLREWRLIYTVDMPGSFVDVSNVSSALKGTANSANDNELLHLAFQRRAWS